MMKERTNPKSVAPRKVKGTVLFTVVCVMLILIVFLSGALALAATANNRAKKNYSYTQTQQAARAGIDAVLSAMQTDVNFAKQVREVTNDDTNSKTLSLSTQTVDGKTIYPIEFSNPDGTGINGMGKITDVDFSYYGSRLFPDDDPNKGLIETKVYKLAVTAEMAGVENTVTAYLQMGAGTPGGGGGPGCGFMSCGTIFSENSTSAFGGTYLGFDLSYRGKSYDEIKASVLGAGKDWPEFTFENCNFYETDMEVVGNVTQSTGDPLIFVVKPGEGVAVWGNYTTHKDIIFETEHAKFTSPLMTGQKYTQVPFLYVEESLNLESTCKSVGNNGMPLNLFLGRLNVDTGAEIPIYATVYCYDENGTSVINNQTNTTTLYKWSDSTFSVKDINNADTTASGDFYSKGSLEVDKNFTVQGKVVIEKDLIVKANMTVTGTVSVGGQIRVESGSLNAPAGIKCDSVSGSVTGPVSGLRPAGATYQPLVKTLKPGYTVEAVETCDVVTGAETVKDGWARACALKDKTTGAIKWYSGQSASTSYTMTIVDNKYYCNYGGWGEDTGVVANKEVCKNPAGTVVSESEAYDISGGKYVDSIGNEVPAPAMFPPEYEKEIIIGESQLGSHPIDDTRIVKSINYVMTQSVDASTIDVKLPSDVTIPSTPVNVADYDSASKCLEKSAYVEGSAGSGKSFYIKAKNGETLWIVLRGTGGTMSFPNGGGIVQVTDDDHRGKVNIMLECNLTFSATPVSSSKSVIYTTEFDSKFASGFEMATATKWGTPELETPTINLYCDMNGGNGYLLKNENTGAIYANIRAPYLKMEWDSNGGGDRMPSKMVYNGYDCKTAPHKERLGPSVIGCCIINYIVGHPDSIAVWYVPDVVPVPTPTPGGDDLFKEVRIVRYENF